MIEYAFRGGRSYFLWIGFLLLLGLIGFYSYQIQYREGLNVTGMSRDISWGLYISNFTFFVGVAASAVMLVLPYYLHNYKAFGRLIILGESLAVSSVVMCMLFITVDLGQPLRLLNLIIHPTPSSMVFWDVIALSGYLVLNLVIGWASQSAQRKHLPPPSWVRPLIYLSIPWAVSIHTVTAFLYAGMPGRHLWLTAILAPRFLASAFASGPSLLILLVFIVRRISSFDPGREPIQTLGKIITYAMIANLFFLGLEFFTAFYSSIPSHSHSLQFLFAGLHGVNFLTPWMYVSLGTGLASIALLIFPHIRNNHFNLGIAAGLILVSTWIDKGLGLVIGGFIPSPLEHITTYTPTAVELGVITGILAVGTLITTILFKIAIEVERETMK